MCFGDIFPHSEGNNSRWIQCIRQALSGGVSAAVDLFAFQIFLWFGASIFLAIVVGGGLSLLVNFVITRRYVIGDAKQFRYSVVTQIIFYGFAFLAWLGITGLAIWILAVLLGMMPILAKVCAIPVGFLWTFVSNNYLVFREKPDGHEQEIDQNGSIPFG